MGILKCIQPFKAYKVAKITQYSRFLWAALSGEGQNLGLQISTG